MTHSLPIYRCSTPRPQNVSQRRSKGTLAQAGGGANLGRPTFRSNGPPSIIIPEVPAPHDGLQASRRMSLAVLIGSVSFLGAQNELSAVSWAASDADALTLMEVGLVGCRNLL